MVQASPRAQRPADNPTQFSRALLECYASARRAPLEKFQDSVFGLLGGLIRFDSGTWGVGSLTEAGVSPHHVRHYRDDPEFSRQWQELKDRDRRLQKLQASGRGAIAIHAPAFFSAKQDRALLDLMMRSGRGNSLISGYFSEDGSIAYWLALHRAAREGHFNGAERSLAAQIYPHLNEALQLNRAIALRELKAGEGPKYAFAIADAMGIVHQATADFVPMIRREWPSVRATMLPSEVLSGSAERFVGREIVLRRRRHHDLMFLKARPRENIDSLTDRELGIAKLITNGMSYKEIARFLGLAPATVRSHTQTIHHKLQVSNVAELTGIMLAGD